jgi:hypothetical protein
MVGGEQNAELPGNSARSGLRGIGRLADFLCYPLACGTGLRSLEPVIMKGERMVHCHCDVMESDHG